MTKSILTIATGKKLYVDMAVNLARSFFWWHPVTDIKFVIVTDNEAALPEDIKLRAEIMIVKPGEFGEGFSPKLYLDQLAPAGQTLFIDSDCLIFEDLSRLFDLFKGKSVSVVGDYIATGEWFGNIEAICKEFKIKHLPKFNGGIYYIEKGEKATQVYTAAREIEKKYDEIGFIRLRNRPNDEVIMALAMQLHQETPLIDDGTILSDPQACPGGYHIDVINGSRWLINPPAPHPLHRDWNPFTKINPAIVHFLGEYALHYPYRREVYLLKMTLKNKLSPVYRTMSLLGIEYPARLTIFFKNTFRPLYHKLFGVRTLKRSERVIN